MIDLNLGKIRLITAIMGIIYLIYGLNEVMSYFGYGRVIIVHPTGNLFVGFALLLISTIYFTGLKKAQEEDFKAVAHLYTGAILGIGFGVLALLVMGANAIEAYVLHSEEFACWSPLDDVTSYLLLGVISIVAYLPVRGVSRKPLKVRV